MNTSKHTYLFYLEMLLSANAHAGNQTSQILTRPIINIICAPHFSMRWGKRGNWMGKPSPRRARAFDITRAMNVRNEHAQEHARKRAMNMREAHYERRERHVGRSRLMKEQREAMLGMQAIILLAAAWRETYRRQITTNANNAIN